MSILSTLEQYRAIYLTLSHQERVSGFSQIVKEWQQQLNAHVYLWNLQHTDFLRLNDYYNLNNKELDSRINSLEDLVLASRPINTDDKLYQNTATKEDTFIRKVAAKREQANPDVYQQAINGLAAISDIEEVVKQGRTHLYIIENIDLLLIKGDHEKKALYESYLIEIVEKFKNHKGLYLVLLGQRNLEWEYKTIVPQVWLPLPDQVERRDIIKKKLQERPHPKNSEIQDTATLTLGGLSKQEIEWILETTDFEESNDIKQILLERKQATLASLNLKFLPPPKIAQIGGMENLENKIEKLRTLYRSDLRREIGLPYPKGFILAGAPGTGKSLAAKVIASRLGFPLALINAEDFKLKGLLGTIQLLKRLEQAAPVVMFLDEMDKLFPDIKTQDNTSKEIFGYLLTWLQEKTAPIFVVATLNRSTQIPIEITRPGRFNAKFHTEYPSPRSRYQIFMIYLKKYDARYRETDEILSKVQWQTLINLTDRYTGAEIEQIVITASENLVVEADRQQLNKEEIEINFQHLEAAAKEVVSLFRTDSRKILEMENSLDGIFTPVGLADESIFADTTIAGWD